VEAVGSALVDRRFLFETILIVTSLLGRPADVAALVLAGAHLAAGSYVLLADHHVVAVLGPTVPIHLEPPLLNGVVLPKAAATRP